MTPHLRLIGATLLASFAGATAFFATGVLFLDESLDSAPEVLVGFTLTAGLIAIPLAYLAWSRRPYRRRTLAAFTAVGAIATGAMLSLFIVLALPQPATASADDSGFADVLLAFLVGLAPAALLWWLLLRGVLTSVGDSPLLARRGREKAVGAGGVSETVPDGSSAAPLADIAADGIKRLSLLAAVGVSVVFAVYDGWLSARHLAPAGVLFFTHRFVVIALLATWLVADARERQRAIFDQGYHAFCLFFVYAPYYLISTRRGHSVYMLAGMGLLFLLPQLAELIASYAS